MESHKYSAQVKIQLHLTIVAQAFTERTIQRAQCLPLKMTQLINQ